MLGGEICTCDVIMHKAITVLALLLHQAAVRYLQ